MSAFRRLELWSNLAVKSGTRLAIATELVSLSETRSVSGEQSLDVTMGFDPIWVAALIEWAVLRVVYQDDTYDEWRITDIAEGRDQQGPLLSIKAAWPSVDLSGYSLVRRVETDGSVRHDFEMLGLTPSQHIATAILPAITLWGGIWAAGEILPGAPVDMVYAWTTAKQALDLLAASTGTELHFRHGAPNQHLNGYLWANSDAWVGGAATGVRDTEHVLPGADASFKVTTTNVASSGAVIYASGSTNIRTILVAGTPMYYACWIYATGSAVGKTLRLVPHYYLTGDTGGGSPDATGIGPTETLVDGWQLLTFEHTVPASMTRGLLTVYTPTAEGVFDVWMAGPVTRTVAPTKYLFDLVGIIGYEEPTVSFRATRNMSGLKRTRSTSEHAHIAYPRGSVTDGIAATMARAQWKVTAVDTGADDVTLADPVGGDGPLLNDDQLNQFYMRRPDGTLDLVTDSFAASQKVRVADASVYSVNDLVQFRSDNVGTGTDMVWIANDNVQYSLYGPHFAVVDRPDIPGTINLSPNPAARAWAGASSVPPDSWTDVGTVTTTKTTTANKWRVGGQSVRCQTTTDGAGIEVNNGVIIPTDAAPYFSGYVSVLLTSGQVRLEMVASDGTETWVIPSGLESKAWTNVVDVWVDLGISGIDLLALGTLGGATSVRLRVVQDEATAADFYVDAFQITQSAGQQSFVEGSGGTQLWQAANRFLERNAYPAVRYDVDILDLNRFDPETWPEDALALGQTVTVYDVELNVNGATRVLEYVRDLLVSMDTRAVLSNRPEDLTDALVRPTRARRFPRDTTIQSIPVITPYYSRVNGQPYQIRVTLQAVPVDAQIKYWVGASNDTVPRLGSVSYNAYVSAFTVDLAASATLNRVVAAYGIIGNRVGVVQTFLLPLSPEPAAPITLSEPVAGTLRVSWLPNAWVRRVRVYVRKHATLYPNGSTDPTDAGGALDETYFVREMSVNPDGGGYDIAGAPVGGGTMLETTGWANTEVARVILIPIDELDNIGTRESANKTMAGAVSPALLTSTNALNSGGASCGSGMTVDFTWTANAGVTDGTHDLLIYSSEDGGAPELIKTEASPDSVNVATAVAIPASISSWDEGTGTKYTFVFTYELKDGATVVDSGSFGLKKIALNTCVP